MFQWYRRWSTKKDFEIYLRVWLQNNNDIIRFVLEDIKDLTSYKDIIDEIISENSIEDKTFMFVGIYFSSRILKMAEYQDKLNEFEECVHQKSYEDIPYSFWLIFHYLFLGVLHQEQGKLNRESFLFGRDKIINFFVEHGMDHDLVMDFITEGIMKYRSMAREAVGKSD